MNGDESPKRWVIEGRAARRWVRDASDTVDGGHYERFVVDASGECYDLPTHIPPGTPVRITVEVIR